MTEFPQAGNRVTTGTDEFAESPVRLAGTFIVEDLNVSRTDIGLKPWSPSDRGEMAPLPEPGPTADSSSVASAFAGVRREREKSLVRESRRGGVDHLNSEAG
jgi:hypothetical protein